MAIVNYNDLDTIVQQRMLWCPKCRPMSSENLSLYFASLTNRSTSSFVDKTMEGIPSSFISSICFNIRGCHLYFFCRCLELINQTFLKASRPNCNNVFLPNKVNSFYLFIFERIKAEISLTRILFKNNRSITNHGTRY